MADGEGDYWRSGCVEVWQTIIFEQHSSSSGCRKVKFGVNELLAQRKQIRHLPNQPHGWDFVPSKVPDVTSSKVYQFSINYLGKKGVSIKNYFLAFFRLKQWFFSLNNTNEIESYSSKPKLWYVIMESKLCFIELYYSEMTNPLHYHIWKLRKIF